MNDLYPPATESNNLAILGGMRGMGRKGHLMTWVTEHKCVLIICQAIGKEGFQVTFLPVQADGLVHLQDLKAGHSAGYRGGFPNDGE